VVLIRCRLSIYVEISGNLSRAASIPRNRCAFRPNRIEALLFPCHFQAIFVGFDSKPSLTPDALASSILYQIAKLTSETPQCGTCTNHTVSVVVDSSSGCVQFRNGEYSAPWQCGALGAVDFGDDEGVDDVLVDLLGGKVYSVVVVNGDSEEVRAVVGKYRHAWVVGRVSEKEAVARAAEIFIKVFVNGGKEEGLIHGEFMPVGADGRIVLSFNLLNSDPQDWVYDWYEAWF
jgi:phosphatidylinositol glycan class S